MNKALKEVLCSEILICAVRWKSTDDSEEYTTFHLQAEVEVKQETNMKQATKICGIISQETEFFITAIVIT
jgi:hypothetical protein